jgi:hypothetical protein
MLSDVDVPFSIRAMCMRSWCFNPVCGYKRISDKGATSCKNAVMRAQTQCLESATVNVLA